MKQQQGTLLLVDDDRHLLASMADWLRDQGFPTDTAASFAEAIAAIDRQAYDLVLTDVRLGDGGEDGFDVLAHCRRHHPSVSVTMLSGYGTVEMAVEAIKLGAFDFLTKPLIDQEGEFAIGSGVYRPDGRRIYFVSNFEGEFSKLYYYDVKDGKIKNLTKKIEWDISGLTVANDGKNLAFTVNENGTERLYIMNTFTNWFSMVDQIPAGTIGAMEFNPAGDKIAFTLNTPQTGDVYSYDLKTNQLMRWTYSEVGGLNPDAFVMPELIHYPTFDNIDSLTQRTIPAYYFKPPGEGPFPVVIYLHGGPEGQFTPYFSSTFNFWLNELGIAILAPNVRGSSGYGKSFLKLDNGFLRENSVKDAGALLDWIEKQPELNSDRIGVMGGSYGGYMVLSMMTHYNDRIAAGVDNVGISNFVTFLKNTGDYRRDLRRAEYGDERGVKMHNFLIRISPLTNASKITKPLFVVQGLNDPRVPVTEAEQMVTVIRNNGGDVWYLLGKDEGHGFSKKTNYDYYRAATVLFWQEYLLK